MPSYTEALSLLCFHAQTAMKSRKLLEQRSSSVLITELMDLLWIHITLSDNVFNSEKEFPG